MEYNFTWFGLLSFEDIELRSCQNLFTEFNGISAGVLIYSGTKMIKRTGWQKLGQMAAMSVAGAVGFSSICIYKGDAKFYQNYLMPVLHRCFDGETAHHASIWAIKKGLVPSSRIKPFETNLTTSFCGIHLSHPVGLAAGFDKDREAIPGLH